MFHNFIIVRTGFDFTQDVDLFPSKAHVEISYLQKNLGPVFLYLSVKPERGEGGEGEGDVQASCRDLTRIQTF